MQRHAVLGEPCRVDQRALCIVDVLVQEVDQHAFVVGLDRLDLHAELGRQRRHLRVDLRQRGVAVDVRLAAAEQVQVRAVQDKELHGISPWHHSLETRSSSDLNRVTMAGS